LIVKCHLAPMTSTSSILASTKEVKQLHQNQHNDNQPKKYHKHNLPNELLLNHSAIISRRQSSSLNLHELIGPDSTEADKNVISREHPVYKIVLTGGPCGGKTTALARLSTYLQERGFEVFTVPEAFTILASNGFSNDYFAAVGGMPRYVQDSVMDIQISLEDSLERVLRARGRPGVILCDRGLMDGSSYMDTLDWEKLLESRDGMTSSDAREGRYNAVFHLVTAAEGAEKYYSKEGKHTYYIFIVLRGVNMHQY